MYGAERTRQLRETELLRTQLKALHGDVDVITFDGKSTSAAEVLDELRTCNLMMTHKLVIIDEAERMLTGSADEEVLAKGAGGEPSDAQSGDAADSAADAAEIAAKARNRELIADYAAKPDPASTLILRAGKKLNVPKFTKAINTYGLVVMTEPLTAPEAVSHVLMLAREQGVKLDTETAVSIVEQVGLNAGQLTSEISKLSLAAFALADAADGKPRGPLTITQQLVEEMTGQSGTKKLFDFQDELLAGQSTAALLLVRKYVSVYRFAPAAISIVLVRLLAELAKISMMASQNEPPASIRGKLRLWGASVQTKLDVGASIRPTTAAELFRLTVDADVKMKSGGDVDPLRVLECAVLRISRTIERVKATSKPAVAAGSSQRWPARR